MGLYHCILLESGPKELTVVRAVSAYLQCFSAALSGACVVVCNKLGLGYFKAFVMYSGDLDEASATMPLRAL
jgi:hypothetical protein